MAISDLHIAVKLSLSLSELDDVGAMVREANWNQLAADWGIFIALGRIYAAHTRAGRIVATVATLPYGGRFAWISMVMVAPEYRRQGLATLLMRRAIDDLVAQNLVPVLDATPDGRPVYRNLGFEDAWGFHRLARGAERSGDSPAAATAAIAAVGGVRAIGAEDWPRVCGYDALAFGADRAAVLAGLRGRLPAAELLAEDAGRVTGFLLGRDGRLAAHLGPLIAEDDAIACALLDRALDGIAGALFVDLPDAKTAVRRLLETRDFRAVRPFTRMLYRTSTAFDDSSRTYAVAGPELG
jgi:GNAT superfamily N-acetyltransferase